MRSSGDREESERGTTARPLAATNEEQPRKTRKSAEKKFKVTAGERLHLSIRLVSRDD